MDTSKYDSQINEAKAEVQRLHEQMEKGRQSLSESVQRHIYDWTKSTVERSVTSKPEVTKSLGLDRLKNLKTELTNLLERIPQLVTSHLENDSLWPHRTELPADIDKASLGSFDLERQVSKELDDSGRELMGYAGQLLIEYGYEDYNWEKRGSMPPRFKYGFSWSDEVQAARQNYLSLLKRYVDASIKVIKLEREKAEAEAKNLWDEA